LVLMERERKLVEKIAAIIREPMAAYVAELGLVYAKIDEKMAAEMAKAIIPRVLTAVASGDIPLNTDEYEEVGLDRLIGWNTGGAAFEKDLEIHLEVGDRVIAFREKEKGEKGLILRDL